MNVVQGTSRPELLGADDAAIEDAIGHAEPMVLRGLLYQLTGDPEVAATGVKTVQAGYADIVAPATDADAALLRAKGAAFLKRYRDGGAGPIDIGPRAAAGEPGAGHGCKIIFHDRVARGCVHAVYAPDKVLRRN